MRQSFLNLKNTLTLVLALALITLDFIAQSQCGGVATFTDARDGNVYSMIQIDGSTTPYCAGTSQCWMSQNLDVGTFITISTAQSSGADNQNTSIERYCYNDNTANCVTYGGLYQWNEMMAYGGSVGGNGPGPQGICPTGWHLPTDNEWKCLEMNLGMTQAQADLTNAWRGTTEGGQVRTTTVWNAPNTGATNTSNFSALPSGHGNPPAFVQLNTGTVFWTTTQTSATRARGRDLLNDRATMARSEDNKTKAKPVRCIRDIAPTPLPIELLYFKAKWTNDQFETVTLDWETITESENSHFEIERSTDAVNFEYVKSIDGSGTSNQNIQYTTLDEDPYVNGTSYYRLKQVDNNGDFEYSNIEVLNIPEGLNMVNLYPNPTVDHLTVLLTSSEDTESTISIKNNLGQEVRLFNQKVNKGFNSLDFSFSELSTGNYTIQISTASGLYKVERKFIKANQ